MHIDKCIGCNDLACDDVEHKCYLVPNIKIQPDNVSIIMISEAAPANPMDYFYSGGDSLLARTTIQAFSDAGADVDSIEDILNLGVYITTAVKCGKTAYNIDTNTIRTCSSILENELSLFPSVKVLMLMGDVAIKSLNAIAKRNGESRPIPVGSTYKIRGGEYYFRGMRVFPSYLQAGPSFFIEKSKRQMIAEDIRNALSLI